MNDWDALFRLDEAEVEASRPLEAGEARGASTGAAWEPLWVVDAGAGSVVGITVDDGCYIVLYPDGDQWRPGTHVPQAAARIIGQLEAVRRDG